MHVPGVLRMSHMKAYRMAIDLIRTCVRAVIYYEITYQGKETHLRVDQALRQSKN